MKIFIVGFMGCGKSTLGRKLAAKLNYQFIDLDHEFETAEQTTIARYFTSYGEDKFRQKESDLLKSTALTEDCVISTGGGVPCFYDNMDWMKANGTVVYIQLQPAVLANRLEHGKEERPLLHGKHGEDLVNFISKKLAEREPFYKQANIIADGLSLNADRLEQILFN